MLPGRLLIVGYGNRLAADDGIGPAVVARLRAGGLPAEVRAEEGGPDALQLPRLWRGEPDVWVVEAVRQGAVPGFVHRLGHDALVRLARRHASAHSPSLPESLVSISSAYPEMHEVRFRLWGVEPARLDPPEGLTPDVARAADDVAREIRHAWSLVARES